jgi:membrane-associated phospholipid phosphatase
MIAANATTQALKLLLGPPATVPGAGWPSGHTTAAATVALGLVMVVTPRARSLAAAAGGLFVAATVYSVLLLGWHFPSDMAGGLCVAGAWMALAVALLGEPAQEQARATLTPSIVAAALACATVAAAVVWRGEAALDYARAHTTFVAGGAALGAAALALATAFALLMRSPRRDTSRTA